MLNRLDGHGAILRELLDNSDQRSVQEWSARRKAAVNNFVMKGVSVIERVGAIENAL
jgi:hypothetical protein